VQATSARPEAEVDAALDRALAWFATVERVCSRFNPGSELARLCRQPGTSVLVSDLLFEAVAFAIEVARLTDGAFDPTVGAAQQRRGFTRDYVTGRERPAGRDTAGATYRDVRLDRRRRSIMLRRPLLLDLGAVAKGIAIDLAARELAGFERFAVEAGGDLYAGGADETAQPWLVGIRHPRRDGLLGTLAIRNQAVCTSGGAERPAPAGQGEHHLLDPRTGRSPRTLAGVTVIAPTALVADALGTAAFVLGPDAGLRLLMEQGVEAIIVTDTAEVRVTPGCTGALSWSPTPEQ
jgi:thiamine biosynthesis lipoprotein